ncbi:hypothetical protein NOF55_10345 [Rhizobiaceae bacterium BDR2-2]|uniref:Type II toxin-antitoxin system ParD family antitoxin n=1 Tax=Ectorhizobium quercum TaxID=2965071 RepID=A0AAE3SW04_9HYPH|nr:hypothetical protein [Ectorhizobium quercum]MCX8997509.1 hypothetical protein [Ectorhizobium quercum]
MKAKLMETNRPLGVILPVEMVDMISEAIASGDYATEGEVVAAGLRLLAARRAQSVPGAGESLVPSRNIPGEDIPSRASREKSSAFAFGRMFGF